MNRFFIDYPLPQTCIGQKAKLGDKLSYSRNVLTIPIGYVPLTKLCLKIDRMVDWKLLDHPNITVMLKWQRTLELNSMPQVSLHPKSFQALRLGLLQPTEELKGVISAYSGGFYRDHLVRAVHRPVRIGGLIFADVHTAFTYYKGRVSLTDIYKYANVSSQWVPVIEQLEPSNNEAVSALKLLF